MWLYHAFKIDTVVKDSYTLEGNEIKNDSQYTLIRVSPILGCRFPTHNSSKLYTFNGTYFNY